MKKITFKKGRLIAFILFIIGTVLLIVSCCISSPNNLAIILFSISIAFFILAIIEWWIFVRCPDCRGLLNLRESLNNFCPHCGKDLNYTD